MYKCQGSDFSFHSIFLSIFNFFVSIFYCIYKTLFPYSNSFKKSTLEKASSLKVLFRQYWFCKVILPSLLEAFLLLLLLLFFFLQDRAALFIFGNNP